MAQERNPYAAGQTDPPEPTEASVRKSANWAVALAALSLLVYPLFGLVGWFFGRSSLKAIQAGNVGLQHRAAAQFGVLVGWYALAQIVFATTLDFMHPS